MSNEAIQASVNPPAGDTITKIVGGAVTGGGGLMLWMAENASAMGVMIALGTFLAYVAFLYLNWKTGRKALLINKRNIKEDLIDGIYAKASAEEKEILSSILERRNREP